jgi:hypothetical protein
MSEMKSDLIEKRREIKMEKQLRKIEKQMGKQGVRKSLTRNLSTYLQWRK